MQLQLLCTFTDKANLYETLHNIRDWYDIVYSSIYVLQNTENTDELFITYNIKNNSNRVQLKDTILIHRKKISNTIYTINALNELIKENNNGVLDTKFLINWNDLKNTIIIWNGIELTRVKTKIHSIFKFNTEN